MRPYRGKRIDNGEWVYGWFVEINGKHYICNDKYAPLGIFYHDKPNGERINLISNLLGGLIKVDPKTVGQDTGEIIDGKEVFAGDILEYWFGAPWNPEQPIRVIGEVIWQDSGWWFHAKGGEYDGHLADIGEGKVIGNIHDNPELEEKE